MEEKLRLPSDRRSGKDRRIFYSWEYSRSEGNEKRSGKERRSGIERRRDWTRVSGEWASVLR